MSDSERNGRMNMDEQSAEKHALERFQMPDSAFMDEQSDQVEGIAIEAGKSRKNLDAGGPREMVPAKESKCDDTAPVVGEGFFEYPKLFSDSEYSYTTSDVPARKEQPTGSMQAIGIGDNFVARVEVARVAKASKEIDTVQLELLRIDKDIRRRISIALIIVLSVLLAGMVAGSVVALFL